MKYCEIDKYGIIIPLNTLNNRKKWYSYNPHITAKSNYGNLMLTVSSKVIMEYNKLGCISEDNIKYHPEIIFNSTGFDIDLETILTSHSFWLDMKTDTYNNTGRPNKDVLSSLRERANTCTHRNEVISYKDLPDDSVSHDKNIGFKNSVLIRSCYKSVKDSLMIYDKIKEIKANRRTDYFNNFSKDFLFDNKNILRFERRLQNKNAIIKAFHLEHQDYVTLLDVFNSDVDVVAEKVNQIFM